MVLVRVVGVPEEAASSARPLTHVPIAGTLRTLRNGMERQRTNMRTQRLSGIPVSQPTLRGASASVIGNPRREPAGRHLFWRMNRALGPEG